MTLEQQKEYRHNYYLKNKERIAARNKAWQHANQERVNARQREKRRANPEPVRAAVRLYRSKHLEERKAYQKRYNELNKDKAKVYYYQHKDGIYCRVYKITVDEYNRMVEAQGGVCAVCHQETRYKSHARSRRGLVIDHDHATGKVRGLLCVGCNLALGYLDDKPELCERLLSYMRKHSQLRLVG